MRISVIPQDRLIALERGCPGFLEAVIEAADEEEPILKILRQGSPDEGYRWYIQVNGFEVTRVLKLDSGNVETMAAAVPIYLVDLVCELREELLVVMSLDGMMEGVEKLIPFIRAFKKERS